LGPRGCFSRNTTVLVKNTVHLESPTTKGKERNITPGAFSYIGFAPVGKNFRKQKLIGLEKAKR